MYQVPSQVGYQFMQLPTQSRQPFQGMAGPSPAMMGAQNALIAQQPNNPLVQATSQVNNATGLAKAVNGLVNPQPDKPQNPLGPQMKPEDALPIAPGQYKSQEALEKAQGPLYDTAYQAEQSAPWLQRLFQGNLQMPSFFGG